MRIMTLVLGALLLALAAAPAAPAANAAMVRPLPSSPREQETFLLMSTKPVWQTSHRKYQHASVLKRCRKNFLYVWYDSSLESDSGDRISIGDWARLPLPRRGGTSWILIVSIGLITTS